MFPDIIGDRYRRGHAYQTSVMRMGSQRPTRYRKWTRARRTFDLGWNLLSKAERVSVEDALHSSYGPFDPFDWWDWQPSEWIWVPVGVGDDIKLKFTLPGKETSNQFFFVNGQPQAGTMDYGSGPNGEDEVTLALLPAEGDIVTAQFYGRRRFSVTAESIQDFSVVQGSIAEYGFGATFVEEK